MAGDGEESRMDANDYVEVVTRFVDAWSRLDPDELASDFTDDCCYHNMPVDRTQAGDKSVDLPCTGVFEMEGGKIKVWRDYFDMSTYTHAML